MKSMRYAEIDALPPLHAADATLLRQIERALPASENALLFDVRWRLVHAGGAEATATRMQSSSEPAFVDAVCNILAENGCDCGCECGFYENAEDCKRCLGCRIETAMVEHGVHPNIGNGKKRT